MGKLLKGQSKDGSSDGDQGTQSGGDVERSASESDVSTASEKFVGGKGGQGFNPEGGE